MDKGTKVTLIAIFWLAVAGTPLTIIDLSWLWRVEFADLVSLPFALLFIKFLFEPEPSPNQRQDLWNAIRSWDGEPEFYKKIWEHEMAFRYFDYPLSLAPIELSQDIRDCLSKHYPKFWKQRESFIEAKNKFESKQIPTDHKLFENEQKALNKSYSDLRESLRKEILERSYTKLKCG